MTETVFQRSLQTPTSLPPATDRVLIQGYGDFILNYSSQYITPRPATFALSQYWPDRYQILDSLVSIADMKYPKFYSPTIYTGATIPESLAMVAPLVTTAHPGITNWTCAVLHPNESSCVKVFGQYVSMQWGRVAKFIAAVYAVIALATYRSIQRRYLPLHFPSFAPHLCLSIYSFFLFCRGAYCIVPVVLFQR